MASRPPIAMQAYPKVWVKLNAYCKLAGEKPDAVRSRMRKGEWLDGTHVKVRNRRLWVNLPQADRWVENGR